MGTYLIDTYTHNANAPEANQPIQTQHVPAHFALTTTHLEAAGYTVVGVSLPSNTASPRVGPDNHLLGISDDVAAVRQTVLTQLEAGQNVVVVVHSYGSICGPAALDGLGLAAREKAGERTGVQALVMIAGFRCPPGGTMLDAMGGQLLPQYLHDHESGTTLPFNGPGAVHMLYNDLETNEAAKAVWKLVPQSYGVNVSEIPDQGRGLEGVAFWFLMCRDDNATPWEMQVGSVRSWREGGVDVRAEVVRSGHSPFLRWPGETAGFVRRAAGEEGEGGFEVF